MKFFSLSCILWGVFWAAICFKSIIDDSQPQILFLICFTANVVCVLFHASNLYRDK